MCARTYVELRSLMIDRWPQCPCRAHAERVHVPSCRRLQVATATARVWSTWVSPFLGSSTAYSLRSSSHQRVVELASTSPKRTPG